MKRLIRKYNAKQVGPIYHFTGLQNLLKILSTDTLKAGTMYISFTRNKNFNNQNRTIGSDMECRIEIDGDQLSNNHKIEPYNDKDYFEYSFEHIRNRQPNSTDLEQEERVKGDIPSIKSYITNITIFSDLCQDGIEKIKHLLNTENPTMEDIKNLFEKFGVQVTIEGNDISSINNNEDNFIDDDFMENDFFDDEELEDFYED